MKKTTFAIAVFILVVSIFIVIIQMRRPEDMTVSVMQKAFDMTGAEVVSSEVYIRGELPAAYFSGTEAQRRLEEDIIKSAGADIGRDTPAFALIENDISTGTETDYIIDEDRRIYVSLLSDNGEESKKNYRLSVSLVDTSRRPDASRFIVAFMNVIRRYGIVPEINISFTGSLGGHLKEEEIERLSSRVLEGIGAEKVEGMNDEGLISISAFSPSIKDSIKVNGRRVNVNLAARYNSYEGKTYIWLATPVITTEY